MTEFERRHVIDANGWPSWYLIGPAGAVQFVAMTTPEGLPVMPGHGAVVDGVHCFGIDIGYHSPTPKHAGQEPMNPCPVYGDVLCYYAGTSLYADDLLKLWAESACNDELIWASLETYYNAWLRDAEGDLFVSPLEAMLHVMREGEEPATGEERGDEGEVFTTEELAERLGIDWPEENDD